MNKRSTQNKMNNYIFSLVAILFCAGAFSQTGLITFSVTQTPPPPTPTVTASNNSVICQGGFVTLTSSSVSGNIWSNGANTQSINVTTAGAYSVTVSSNGCSSTSNPVTVTSTSINISVNISSPSCGASNGSITATVSGGQSPYAVQWSNGDVGLTADSLAPGQYVVQVTDANGCYNSLTVNLNPSNGPSVTATSQNNVTCNGGSNGLIALNVSGGANPISILWSNGASTSTVSNLQIGRAHV